MNDLVANTPALQSMLEMIDRRYARIYTGLSGGLDSVVLVHLLVRHLGPHRVVALHVNHNLSANASQWVHFCQNFCGYLGCRLSVESVCVDNSLGDVEQRARDLRYRVFARQVPHNAALCVAHHGGDQAETLLYRLFRGAGLQGLTAMKAEQQLNFSDKPLVVLRPLLSVTRQDLADYAKSFRLSWVDDESNQNTAFDRNYIRCEVLPVIRQRWPVADARITAAAQRLGESASLLDEYAAEDLQRCERCAERLGESIALLGLRTLSPARQIAVVRYWIRHCGFPVPSADQWCQYENVIHAADDASPVWAWGESEIRRYRQRLYLMPRLDKRRHDAGLEQVWQSKTALNCAGGLTLQTAAPVPSSYTVRYRRGGERAHPRDRAHSQTLKKLLQEYALEPWLRDWVPLLYKGETLVAVGDLWVEKAAPPVVLQELSSLHWGTPTR